MTATQLRITTMCHLYVYYRTWWHEWNDEMMKIRNWWINYMMKRWNVEWCNMNWKWYVYVFYLDVFWYFGGNQRAAAGRPGTGRINITCISPRQTPAHSMIHVQHSAWTGSPYLPLQMCDVHCKLKMACAVYGTGMAAPPCLLLSVHLCVRIPSVVHFSAVGIDSRGKCHRCSICGLALATSMTCVR